VTAWHHGTPGSICAPMLHLRDAQRLHARAGGFAAGHDELAHAKFDQPARNRGDAALDHGAGRSTPSCACMDFTAPGSAVE
jgi:hypothetical protein